MELRPYQKKLINDIRTSIRVHDSAVAVLGCGGGKSVIQAEISRLATEKGNRVQFLVHRKELCQQITNTFVKQGVDMELCSIDMVQTVSRHIDKIPTPRIIITDEAATLLRARFKMIYMRRDDKFGNAREARNMFESVKANMATRTSLLASPTLEELKTIQPEDIR